MALTYEDIEGNVRDYCGNPPDSKLPPNRIYTMVYDTVKELCVELALTDEGWSLDRHNLNAIAGVEEYSLTNLGIGRPFLVETYDPADPYMRRRTIEMVRPQDRTVMASNNMSPTTFYGTSGASRIVFWNVGQGVVKAQLSPIPSAPKTYRIWHESILTDNPSIKDTPQFLQQFFPLITAMAAEYLVTTCGWPVEQVTVMAGGLSRIVGRRFDAFDRYVQQSFHSTISTIKAANSSRRGRRGR